MEQLQKDLIELMWQLPAILVWWAWLLWQKIKTNLATQKIKD